MKSKSFSKFIYLFLALVFCAAVSGGCGGGSSSHSSGNFAVTSDDVTPVPDKPTSEDVSVPDNTTSDDDYGVNRDYHSFTQLNNTEWRITNVFVHVKYKSGTENCTVEENSYNRNVSKITLQILGDDALLWYDGDGMPYGNWTSPLTVNFHDSNWIWDKAPILRSSENFEEDIDDRRFCRYEVIAGEKDSETISVYYDNSNRMSSMNIVNVFVIDGVEYDSEITLVPYNSTK